ncbi:hypothetical protein L6E12_26890 [Actinokineospora sp. PR83]|uniref:AMIN-like domain-containing (lipo)protein n=1 Tax=Actinokineospora sp. PR83 TaxID=2884908 RepID=UPI001F17264A|nr:hypothetical protein [Actinokineospora sp. PR83]MCG8919407.1 hypothetical protein [Actinokineospora sp. PR83]
MRRNAFRIALVAATAAALLPVTTATAATSYCGITWGSGAKTAPPTAYGPLTDVRAGTQPCFDRLVLDVAATSGYRVEYVPAVSEDPTGDPVPLRGGAFLQVIAENPAYDDAGNPTYLPANRAELVDATGLPTLRQVAWAGSFEGQTGLGVGVRARLPFRVLVLSGPPRLVVDVAHQW